ncbi:hypothetical protein QCN29_12685 [Streptomyces sp. HNM0663]|uniref:Uncharacterized protein n=1 Tax=Streptomyces chengmaiensis TaxID=3040919 RepID=A0ABT6HNL7_9ACTN|nr:hypothetical protein [Streptomyces chengmaiensis]MDH2389634.1 hypothetical protein [Streptomyces chengmaiensis]
MTGRATPHLPSQSAELGTAAPFYPRLGDLARDTARNGRIGVVVALPRTGTTTYHLRPPGGGDEWSAPADGTTLRPVPAQVTHITPAKRDVFYDHRAQQGAMPVVVHYEDGGTSEAVLVITPDQLELYACQVAWIIKLREEARECEA